MSTYLEISKQIDELWDDLGTVEYGPAKELLDSLSPKERHEFDRGSEAFEIVSGNACPTMENIVKYDRAVEEYLAAH